MATFATILPRETVPARAVRRAGAACHLALLACAITPMGASAAVFCATTSAQLQAALVVARDNSQADEVRVATGHYEIPADGAFRYEPEFFDGDDFAITITGGWTTLGGNPCGEQLVTTSPLDTTLDGDNRDRALHLILRENSDATVARLTFVDGYSPEATGSVGGGLRITTHNPGFNEVRVDRCAFIDNAGDTSTALAIRYAGTTRVQNSLFLLNHAVVGPVFLITADANSSVYFINNTVYANAVSSGITGGAYFSAFEGGQAFIANNLFWGNDGFDVQVFSPDGNMVFRNNDYGSRGTPDAQVEVDNLMVAPVFSGALLDFTPLPGTALVNAGHNRPAFTPVPPTFEYEWTEGTHDFAGNTRRQGGRIDIGAFESAPPLFADGFETP